MCPKNMVSSDFSVGLKRHAQFPLGVLHECSLRSDEAPLAMPHGQSRQASHRTVIFHAAQFRLRPIDAR